MFPNIRVHVDGRTFLGAVLIAGYMLLIGRLIGRKIDMPINNAGLVKDSLLVLGPAIGVIVGAIWRTSGAEERTREILATGAVSSSPVETTPNLTQPEVRNAVADGTATGVTAAVAEIVGSPSSFGGEQMPDWVAPPPAAPDRPAPAAGEVVETME